MVFRVMNYNAWYGGSKAYWTRQGEDAKVGVNLALQKVAALLVANTGGHRAIIGMQEVYTGSKVADYLDVPQTIADAMSGFTSDYLPLMPSGGGDYGLGNLYSVAKYKEQEWRFAFDPNNKADWGGQPRGANATKHNFGGGKVMWFVNTHLGSVLEDNGVVAQRQLFELLGRIKTLDPDQPVIVVGDFNIKAAMKQPYAALKALFGDPAMAGFSLVYEHLRMYIFRYDPHRRLIARRTAIKVAPVWGGITLSDHRLLVAEFAWR